MSGTRTDVATLLARQAEVLGHLDALSQRQGELLECDDTAGLAEVIEERGALIEHALALADEITRALAGAGGVLTPEQRERSAGLEAMARAIAERDAEHRACMERRRDELAAEIAGLSVTRRAAGAYGGGAAPGAGARYKDEQA